MTLPSGRKINIRNMYIRHTFCEVGICSPGFVEMRNEDIIARTSYPTELWGEGRKSLLIRPKREEMEFLFSRESVEKHTLARTYKDVKLLPDRIVSIYCTSDAMNKEFFGSCLIITWFADVDDNQSMHDIAYPVLSTVDWEKEAVDYHP